MAGVTVHALCQARFGHADAETTTDEEGRYELAALPTTFVQKLRAESPNYKTVTDVTRLAPVRHGESFRRDLEVAPAVWLTGRVQGSTGELLPGAEVRGHFPMSTGSTECHVVRAGADDVFRMACRPGAHLALEARFPGHVQPGAPERMGEALLGGLVPEEYLVRLPLRGDAERDVRLIRGLALQGSTVGPEGAALAGVRVSASGPRGHTSTSATDGTFRLEDLPPGDFRLRARKAGWCPAETAPIHLAAGPVGNPLEIRLLRAPVVEGRVQNS